MISAGPSCFPRDLAVFWRADKVYESTFSIDLKVVGSSVDPRTGKPLVKLSKVMDGSTK